MIDLALQLSQSGRALSGYVSLDKTLVFTVEHTLQEDGDALTLTAVSTPQFGTATINGQSVVYTPNAGFTGVDTFTYFVSDGKGGKAAGTVTITVTGDTPSGGNSIYLPLIDQ